MLRQKKKKQKAGKADPLLCTIVSIIQFKENTLFYSLSVSDVCERGEGCGGEHLMKSEKQ